MKCCFIRRKTEYGYDEICFDDGTKWKVKEEVPEFIKNGIDSMQVMPSMFIFVKDMDTVQEYYEKWKVVQGEPLLEINDYYGFDLDCRLFKI